MTRNFLLQIGDIVAFRTPGVLGEMNVRYQRLRRNRSVVKSVASHHFIPTHVAMVINPDQIIHSTKGRVEGANPGTRLRDQVDALKKIVRVGFQRAEEEDFNEVILGMARRILGKGVVIDELYGCLKSYADKDILLLRHPALIRSGRDARLMDQDLMAKILQSAFYHLDKPYNALVELSRGGNRMAFCSQLIAQIFAGVQISLPREAHSRVLPIDYVYWGITDGWQIVPGTVVKRACEERNKYNDNNSYSSRVDQDVSVKIHKGIVKHMREMNYVSRALDEFNELAVDLIDQGDGRSLPPRLWIKAGLAPIALPLKGAVLAAASVRAYAAALSPGLEIAGADASARREDDDGRQISWLLNRGSKAQVSATGVPGAPDPETKLACHFLGLVEEALDDLDVALADALAYLQTLEGRPGQALDADEDLMARDGPLMALVSVAKRFGEDEEIEQVETIRADVRREYDALAQELRERTEENIKLMHEYCSEEGCDTQKCVKIQENFKHNKTILVILIQYAIANDFVNTAKFLRFEEKRKDFSEDIEVAARWNAAKLSEFLSSLRCDALNERKVYKKLLEDMKAHVTAAGAST